MAFNFRIWHFAFYVCVLRITLSEGNRGILIDEPKNSWKKWVPEFRGTSWTLLKYSMKDVFASCPVGSSNEDWLLSPFIPIPSTVRTLTVKFKYTVRKCSSLLNPPSGCRETLEFVKREESKPVMISKLRARRFEGLTNFTPSTEEFASTPPVQAGPKSTFNDIIRTQAGGIYLAVKNMGVCMALFSFEVTYGNCLSQGVNLVTLKNIVSPTTGSPAIEVNGSCVDHAVPAPGTSRLYALCHSNGEWIAGVNVSCVCTAGYQENTTTNICEGCPKGTFKMKTGNESCIKCPLHSSQNPKRTNCTCDAEYYRAEGEDDKTNCTTIPSAPQNLTAPFLNASAAQLIWKEPENNGGRSDVFYVVKCLLNENDCGSEVRFHPKPTRLKTRSVIISGLLPFRKYTFEVYAKNGVSKFSLKKKYLDIELTTKESLPGMPTDFRITREKSIAHLKWVLEEPNGKVLFYEVHYRHLKSRKSRIFNTTHTNVTIRGLDPKSVYSFKVRAYTSSGFGRFSEEKRSEFVGTKGFMERPEVRYSIIAAGAFVLFLVVVICILCCRRRNSNYKNGLEKGLEMLPSDGQRLYIDPSTYGDLLAALNTFASEISKSYVKLEKIIGGGEFGEVHKGTLNLPKRGPEVVAVKLLKRDATLKSRDDFLSEAAVLGQFKHSNVIEMKGVVTKSAPMMIILEFMENGSLDNFLKTHDNQLTNLQLIGMARGVASGMAYLAEMNFIHRDLAARNILVAENKACKVADFGLSRELESDNPDSEYLTQGGKIAVRWTALEAIKYRKFSSASDVWSYGILLWEIMTFGERPYWDWTNFQVMDRIEAGYRLPNPANCPKVIYNIMLDCWIEDKTRRPRFPEIVKRLEELIRSPDLLRDDMIDRVSRANTIDFDQIDTVPGWLESIHMGQYKPNFEEAGYVALKQLVEVDDHELDKIGVRLIGHRNKIKKNLRGLQDFLEQNASKVSCEVKL